MPTDFPVGIRSLVEQDPTHCKARGI
jgi:hypothetical protein